MHGGCAVPAGRLIITGSALPVSREEIVQELGSLDFPGYEQVIAFYLEHNGGKPNRAVVAEPISASIRYFYSMKHRFHPRVGTFEEHNSVLRSSPQLGRYFTGLVAFGEDDGGNKLCIRKSDGAVIFVPLDLGDDFEIRSKLLAPSFSEFLGVLDFYENVFDD